jgi:hypothetical protein
LRLSIARRIFAPLNIGENIMSALQLYIYLSGFVAFFLGCFFYYQSRKEDLSEKQMIARRRVMNFFLIIGFICVVYSWL